MFSILSAERLILALNPVTGEGMKKKTGFDG